MNLGKKNKQKNIYKIINYTSTDIVKKWKFT